MFILNKSQKVKFIFFAIKVANRLVVGQLARGKHKQNMDNKGLVAEIQKKSAIWEPKDAHYFCALCMVFVYSTVFKQTFYLRSP